MEEVKGWLVKTIEESGDGLSADIICEIFQKVLKLKTPGVTSATNQNNGRPLKVKELISRIFSPAADQQISKDMLDELYRSRELILDKNRQELPQFDEDPDVLNPTDLQFQLVAVLHRKLSSATTSLSEKKENAKELLRLTGERLTFRSIYVRRPQFLFHLLKAFPHTEGCEIDHEVHECLITILCHLSSYEAVKKDLGVYVMTITALIQTLKSKKPEIRSKGAETIHSLTYLDSNKELIGDSGVFKLLIDLLRDDESPQVKTASVRAIFNLCVNDKNKERAERLDAVTVVAEKIIGDTAFTDGVLPILTLLSFQRHACETLERLDFAPLMLGIVRHEPSELSREYAIWILHNVLKENQPQWIDKIRKEEETHQTITKISQNGSSRARMKANAMLERLNLP